VTSGSGTLADIRRGARVRVETAGGAFKGHLSIRAAGTISAVNIPVREVSTQEVKLADTDVLKIYDDFLIVDKLPAADDTFAPDQEAYVAQNTDPRPVATSGGWWAGWLADADDGIQFIGSNSFNIDPDTASTLTYAWAAPGSSEVSSVSADPTFTYTAAGKYIVTNTVTAVNTETNDAFARVRVHDADDPPIIGVEAAPMTTDAENGWSYSIEVFDAFDTDTLYDGAPVVIWVDERINNITQSFGNKILHRSHIKVAGYLRRDESSFDDGAGRHRLVFEIVSPLQKMNELPGFSKAFITAAVPATWQEFVSLDTRRMIVQIIDRYTNMSSIHDLTFDGDFPVLSFPSAFISKNDPKSQVVELADASDSRIIVDRVGRIEFQQRAEFLSLTDQAAITTTLTVGDADIKRYQLARDHYEPVETFRFQGFLADATNPTAAFARWPDSPARGKDSTTVTKIISSDSTDFLERAGRRGAWANKTITKADGTKFKAPTLTIELPGSYDVFDLYREQVAVNFTGNMRVTMSDYAWVVTRITTEWIDGNANVVLDLQAITHGEPGVDDPQPEGNFPAIPPLADPPQIPTDGPTTPTEKGLPLELASIRTIGTDNHIYFYDVDTDTWTDEGDISVSGTVVGYSFDAFSVVGGGQPAAWIATNTTIYKMTFANTPASRLFTQGTDTATGLGLATGFNTRVALVSERGTPNRVAANQQNAAFNNRWVYSTDGATWTQAFYGTINPGASDIAAGNSLSHRTGRFYLSNINDDINQTGTGTPDVASFSAIAGVDGGDRNAAIHLPFDQPGGVDTVLYYGVVRAATSVLEFRRGDIVAGSFVDVTPADLGVDFAPVISDGISTSPSDYQLVVVVGRSAFPVTGPAVKIFVSTDAGATWDLISDIAVSNPNYSRVQVVSDTVAWLYGTKGVAIVTDLNTTPVITDLAWTGSGEVIGIWGA
jgi:hypothetical protein